MGSDLSGNTVVSPSFGKKKLQTPPENVDGDPKADTSKAADTGGSARGATADADVHFLPVTRDD